jgi:hypothetical protein
MRSFDRIVEVRDRAARVGVVVVTVPKYPLPTHEVVHVGCDIPRSDAQWRAEFDTVGPEVPRNRAILHD